MERLESCHQNIDKFDGVRFLFPTILHVSRWHGRKRKNDHMRMVVMTFASQRMFEGYPASQPPVAMQQVCGLYEARKWTKGGWATLANA